MFTTMQKFLFTRQKTEARAVCGTVCSSNPLDLMKMKRSFHYIAFT